MREGRSMAGTWKLHHDAPVYTSLIPGFSPPGVLEHFQYANAKQKTSEILLCVVMLGSIRQEGGICREGGAVSEISRSLSRVPDKELY